jgi:hypothetical protein
MNLVFKRLRLNLKVVRAQIHSFIPDHFGKMFHEIRAIVRDTFPQNSAHKTNLGARLSRLKHELSSRFHARSVMIRRERQEA